jgi:hypothetical protein
MWSAVRSGCFISGIDPVPIVQERGWASALLLDGRTNLAAPGFDPWAAQPITICYTVYAIPTAVYNVGTEVNLVVQTDIRTLLPKRINNNADHYMRTCVVLFLSGTTMYSMGLPFFRGMTLRQWVIVSEHFETSCVLSLMGRYVHQHGTWTFRLLKIRTLRSFETSGPDCAVTESQL